MDEAPVVSILVPVKNGAAFISDSLASALSQTVDAIEVIVIDDASDDDTAEVVLALASKDPRLRLIQSDVNGGPGVARSLGLRTARGTWVAILDADDQMAPDRLERLVHEAEGEALDAIADNLSLVDPGLGTSVGQAFPLDPEDAVDITAERFVANIRPGARLNLGWMQPLVRRSFLNTHEIEWPPIRHAEDAVFIMRLLQAGARFRLVGTPSYHYTQRRGTTSGQASTTSRTHRSTTEQQRALDLILEEGTNLSAAARKRIVHMKSEISATTHAIALRDAIQDRRPIKAIKSVLKLGWFPASLGRCLWQRYMIGWRLR